MKYKHKRNISLAQENSYHNLGSHKRTLSHGRYPVKNHQKMYLLHNDYIVSDSLTLPVSSEFIKQYKNKSMETKMLAGHCKKSKQLIKSKQKHSDCIKKRKQNQTIVGKKSKQKNQKSNPKQTKQLTKMKMHAYNQNNTEQGVKNNNQKIQIKRKQQYNTKIQHKKVHNDEIHPNCEQIIEEYKDILTQNQILEIIQYKWIYFLGKIQNRVRPIYSSQHVIDDIDDDESLFNKNNNKQATFHIQEQSQDQFYHYELGDHIAYRYEIIESINQGSFGQVIKVFDHKLKQNMALKIVKKSKDLVKQTFIEISILTQIKEKDKANLSGIVRIKDFTIFRDHICMLFQLLDGNLYELLVLNNYNGLNLDIIRIFAVQILNSLCFLHKEKIIHCDIKPENIVMKSWGKSGVKLIDFGSSCYAGQQVFEYIQSRFYRAPQVMLKQPYSFEIDMWSFGCLLAQLKLGQPIFAGLNNIEQLMYIVNSLGFPLDKQGIYSRQFYYDPQMQEIRKKNYIQQYHYMLKKSISFQTHQFFSKCKYKHKCMKTLKERIQASNGIKQQNLVFLSFLEKLIVWEPKKRLKPHEALRDPWILNGLPTEIKQLYTMLNSVQAKKKSTSKSKSKQSKGSKNKQKQQKKKSTQKTKSKQLPTNKKKIIGSFQLNNKQLNHDNNYYVFDNISSSLKHK